MDKNKLVDFVYEQFGNKFTKEDCEELIECGELINNKADEYNKIREVNNRLPVSGNAMRNILNHCKKRD